jgi:predicted metal-dependent phosphoesterase TrpH
MSDIQAHFIPIDFHCHSVNSDGAFPVKQVLDMAKANGGKYLALTDHDTVDGVHEARQYANQIGLNFFGGVEISVTWTGNTLIHILGLNIDENNEELVTNLDKMRNSRIERGRKIAHNLAKIGIYNSFEGAMKYCNNEKALSRTHFNQFLVANGHAKPGKAFDKYLAPGRPGYVAQQWASLEDALKWINNSGGIAVIAHPCRYKFTRTKLLRLIDEFKHFGGRGIEVISSSHSKDDALYTAHIAKVSGLLSSMGSDFHSLEANYKKILVGVNPPLPDICQPIYTEFGINLGT